MPLMRSRKLEIRLWLHQIQDLNTSEKTELVSTNYISVHGLWETNNSILQVYLTARISKRMHPCEVRCMWLIDLIEFYYNY